MNTLLSVRDLSKSFPGVRALDKVCFDLHKGEVHALMGENGAGKSTLVKILAGICHKDSGELFLEGKPIEINSPAQAQSLAIGMVHQELHLMEHLTAAQNMFLGREPKKFGGMLLDENKLNQQAQALFDKLHLRLNPATLVSGLSVACRQMVEIAKALSHSSRVLIMDEPTAALNSAEIEELFRIIQQLKQDGVGIVYISHRMDEIQHIADRITVLRDGVHVATVPSHTPMSHVIRLMVGRPLLPTEKAIPNGTNSEVLLEARAINRGKWVRDVSFQLRRGEILGVAGLMGAGRTELARALFGADPMDSGAVFIRGKLAKIRSPKDAVEAGLAYLPEDRKRLGLVTGMDIAANLTLPSLKKWLYGRCFLRSKAIESVACRMVQRLRIKTPSVNQTTLQLSGGNQQKVVIAKWLLQDCDILMVDEPTRGIDIGSKQEIYGLIHQLAAQGRAVVVISSELPEVLLLSHRILVMCEGRVSGELRAHEANAHNVMALATRYQRTAPCEALA